MTKMDVRLGAFFKPPSWVRSSFYGVFFFGEKSDPSYRGHEMGPIFREQTGR